MKELEDCIPRRRITTKGPVDEYVSCWTEKDLLSGEIVDAVVVILRTSGCSWARKKGCTMCGYINDCNPEVSGENLITQTERAFEKANGGDVLKIFTSGSFLDDREISHEARQKILERASGRFEQVTIETRPEYVTRESLEDCLSRVENLQVALGLESANDLVLSHSINKGFLFSDYQKAADIVREVGASLKTYLLLKPPFLTEEDAINDSIESAKKIKDITDVISLNPVNVQKGTLVERLWHRNEYRPPWLWSVIQVLEECKNFVPRIISSPTGGGRKRGSHNCFECDSDALKGIEEFSLGQRKDFADLDCECKERWMDTLELQGFSQSSIDIERYYE